MPKPKVFNPELKIGNSVEVELVCCDNAQVKIQLEPSYEDPEMARQFGGKARRVMYCPFCGKEDQLAEV